MTELNRENYYTEPVEVEIYLKKAGRVRTIIKDLNIELIDVEPLDNNYSPQIFNKFKEENLPIDLMELQNHFPQFIKIIYDSYYQNMDLFEKISMHFNSAISGSTESWRQVLYFTELMLKYEPTIASTEYIGDFQTYNLNYIIKKLNNLGEKFLLEDQTVSYLIRRRNKKYENEKPDREFNKLVELWQYHIKNKFL